MYLRSKQATFSLSALLLAIAAVLSNTVPALSLEHKNDMTNNSCGYSMCQYEKENIDTIIMAHARTSQTIMFGEIHDKYMEEMPAPIEDSIYVTSLLAPLKAIGYVYLALEVNENASENTHSHDILRFYTDYNRGQQIPSEHYSHAKPGWIEMIREAFDLGYEIHFIDVPVAGRMGSFGRDLRMFEKMKKEIFAKDGTAKVIVYIGALHVSERETDETVCLPEGTKLLGYYLDHYTQGRNYSVYMGNTHDTPVGSDLAISYFIWKPWIR